MKLITALACALVLGSSPAFAHGEVEKRSPPPGARVAKAPAHVSITFTEAPAEGALLRVLDGCKKNIVPEPLIAERTLHSLLDPSQPGRWKVVYRVISAEDGHLTKGSYKFTVKGTKDCSSGDDAQIGPATSPITPDPPSDEGGFPLVPVAVGGGLVLIAALAIRVASGRTGS